MPPISNPSGSHSLRASPRRRSKPKFEVPLEPELPVAAAWVYRAPDVQALVPPAPRVPISAPAAAPPKPDSRLAVAADLMATGAAVFTRINMVAFHVMTSPFRLAGRLF